MTRASATWPVLPADLIFLWVCLIRPGKASASVTLFSDRSTGGADNLMRVHINGQMQFSPDTTALFAVLFDFPLALPENFQAGGV